VGASHSVCEEEECTAFLTELAETGVREACAHDSYLINLASPDPVLRPSSRPGSYLGPVHDLIRFFRVPYQRKRQSG